MAKLSATERLAQEELDRRTAESIKELLKPMNEESKEQKQQSQEWTKRADEIMRQKADEKKRQEEAQAAAEAEAEARKPEKTKEAYRELLHSMKGEQ